MNVRTNPHWARLKAHGIATLGHDGFAEFLRFASQSIANVGADGAVEHFAFAARQVELEGKRHEAA